MTASYPKNIELEQQIKKVYGEISKKLQQEHSDKLIPSNRASTKVKGEVNTLEIFSTEGFVEDTIDSLKNQCFAIKVYDNKVNNSRYFDMYTLRIETYHTSIEAIYHKDPSVKYEYVDFTNNIQGFISEINKIVD